jgi:UDP-N-acetylglucosamine diphosphorylase/glucosamine-1-phosphate N-acetyltransferase
VLICSDSIPKDNDNILNIGAEMMSLKQIQKEWALKFPGYKPDFNSNNDFLNNQMSFWKDTVSNVDVSSNALFNDENGPIIIEENVTIMEGAMIRGPVHICNGSVIKMGAKIYGPTVIGPYCKVGGEVSDSIFLGYANKSHDGFLGHSIVGEWCNIGAGTSSSNLKNDYSTIKMWNYDKQQFIDSKQQYLGLYMGDHSKSAINTSFNTGTTIGVNCNIFGAGFPRNFIPSFSWGGSQGIKNYNIDKAIAVANKVMARRNMLLTAEYENLLRSVFDITANFRHKE